MQMRGLWLLTKSCHIRGLTMVYTAQKGVTWKVSRLPAKAKKSSHLPRLRRQSSVCAAADLSLLLVPNSEAILKCRTKNQFRPNFLKLESHCRMQNQVDSGGHWNWLWWWLSSLLENKPALRICRLLKRVISFVKCNYNSQKMYMLSPNQMKENAKRRDGLPLYRTLKFLIKPRLS